MIASNFTPKSHKNFWRYVTVEMPKVMNVPVIVRAMATHGFLSSHAFRTALTDGQPPVLHLVNNLKDATGKKRWGYTPPNPPVLLQGALPPANSILLEKLLADEFETVGPRMERISFDPAIKTRVIKAGATLLHEFCHWGDWQAHSAFTDVWPQDYGEDFEFEVYGTTI